MTEQEINEAVARKLGKELCQDPTCLGDLEGCELAPKHYATDIKAAWEIVDKFCDEGGWDITMAGGDRANGWCVTITDAGEQVHSCDDTAPRAICLAFLKLNGQ